jgi:hypothetical protein
LGLYWQESLAKTASFNRWVFAPLREQLKRCRMQQYDRKPGRENKADDNLAHSAGKCGQKKCLPAEASVFCIAELSIFF